MTNNELSVLIKHHQDIQKKHHYKTPQWQSASKALKPLFIEANTRQQHGEIIEDLNQ